jgi:hypothetical protein
MNNNIIKHADKDKGVKFLYDKIHRISNNQQVGAVYPQYFQKEPTKTIKLWIKRKRSRGTGGVRRLG